MPRLPLPAYNEERKKRRGRATRRPLDHMAPIRRCLKSGRGFF
ncbi:hypothetical protein [Geobacillus sp. TFV-3]|nr:hypothetical protein [Geobacillus sp. TFV-3]